MYNLGDDNTSTIQNQGGVFQQIPKQMSTGTRFSERYFGAQVIMDGAKTLFVPYYNCFDIPLGNAYNQRTGSAIFIHRIEIQVSIRPDYQYSTVPNGYSDTTTGDQVTDFRIRLLATAQKKMVSAFPIDYTASSTTGGTFPYWSSSASGTYPQPISPPIDQGQLNSDQGFLGCVDARNYNTVHDEVYNPTDKFSPNFAFQENIVVRKRFDYDTTASGTIAVNDTSLWYMLPQYWLLLGKQSQLQNVPPTCRFQFNIYCKLYFDSQ